MSDAEAGLVDAYRTLGGPAFDEMLDGSGAVRPAWRPLADALDLLGAPGLESTRLNASRLLDSDGVVYRTLGTSEPQPWQLDPVPMLLDDAEWSVLEPGLAQRARLLNALVADLYGPRTLLREGVVPAAVVLAHQGFLRSCDQLRVPGGVHLVTVAADLARGPDGRWLVLHDRAASPSGSGFAMENRRVVSRVLTGPFREARTTQLGPFFQAMRLGLQEVAPASAEAPRVVLLTSGPMSETAYDQAFLSQLLGYPLVAGSDLTVQDGKVWLRGLDGLEQVDVVLRRVDSDFCDPLELRPESQLGVPGLLEACRLGTVSVVNALGAGVLENPGLLPYLPAAARALLEEDLLLPSAESWWCGDPASLDHVRAHVDSLVLKPIARGASRSSSFGWELSADERARLLARIESEPHLWVGQQPVTPSTAPTSELGGVSRRSMVLRSFAVAQGGTYHVMPGGLVRVAGRPDSLLVSAQAGAVTKDAWVLSTRALPVGEAWRSEGTPSEVRQAVVSSRMAEDLFWLGRYAERAEATTRLLRAVRERTRFVNQAADPTEAACVDALLQVLTAVTATWPGFAGPAGAGRRAAPQPELLSLVLDAHRQGSLAHSVACLTTATHAVRDYLSPDTWIVLGNLDTVLRDLRQAEAGTGAGEALVAQTLTRCLGSLLALAGMAAESMVRDLGWRFLEAGRRLERAQQVVALLKAALLEQRPPEVDALVAESVLVAAESILTYRRRYAQQSEATTILELLLVDRENPRSVVHALDRLRTSLQHAPDSTLLLQEVDSITASLRSGYARAVSGPAVSGRRPALGEFLSTAERRLRALADGLAATYFEDVLAPVPYTQVRT